MFSPKKWGPTERKRWKVSPGESGGRESRKVGWDGVDSREKFCGQLLGDGYIPEYIPIPSFFFRYHFRRLSPISIRLSKR